MRGLLEDLKHALRLYRRAPVASLVVIAVLAIGMAFVAAFVSLYVDLILRPHPGFEDSSRLVTVTLSDGRTSDGLPADLINRISRESATLDALAGALVLFFEAGSMQRSGELVTRDFFRGIKPRIARGRGFLPEEHEPESEPVVVISHRYWQEVLDGREDVLGTAIEIKPISWLVVLNMDDPAPEPRAFRIVGVMAPELDGVRAQPGRELSFWLAFEPALPTLVRGAGAQPSWTTQMVATTLPMQTVGIRKPGATAAAIAGELDARFLEAVPNLSSRPGVRFDALAGLVLDPNVQRSTQRQLQLFLGASILLAIVAAANVSLFLLARAPGRRRELAIRMSVGAPLRRLARQLATEAGVIVVAGALVGLVLSIWLAEFLRGLTFLRQAQWRNVTLLDWRVLAIVGLFLCLLTLLVSLAPILGLKGLGIAASSRQVSARATLVQRVAGTVQIAIAGVLGGAAIAFAWYLGALLVAYPGYETRNVHAVRYNVPLTSTSSAQSLMLSRARAREAIAALPGVMAVSLTGAAPGVQFGARTRIIPDPQKPGEQLSVFTVPIDAGYVDLLGLRLLYGRSPSATEPDAALVNRRLARQLFGRDDVVGEAVIWGGPEAPRSEIVGVLEDLSFEHPLAEIRPTVFMMDSPSSAFYINGLMLIESAQASGMLLGAIEGLADTGALEVSPGNIAPLAEARSNLLAPDRARSLLTIGTAALVVLLAAFGFYGTQRYLVAAARREYAIRASLGAGPSALGRLVFARGFLLGLPGLVLGLPLAFIVVAWLRDDYVSRDVSPGFVTLAVALGLATLLLAASIGPARHARATQPAPLLRED